MERRGRLEELDRKAEDIRDFIIDVYCDVDLPIGPLLDAYSNAVAELVQEERRGRLVPRVLDGLVAGIKAVRWRDERKLIRALDGPFATLFVLLVQLIKSGDISPKEAATRWAHEICEAYKATGPSPDPLLINLENLEAAFTRAAPRHDRFAALYRHRRGRWRRQ